MLEVTRPVEGVAVLTLQRPERRNALSIELRDRISDALDALAADETCRCAVITGSGAVFCAGFDLSEFETAAVDEAWSARLWASSDRYHRTVHRCPVPTLAVKTETTGTLTAGSPITFSVTSAIPSGGTSQIREVTVDFGDGSGITSLGPLNGTSNVQHVYPDVGSARSYTIKATLTDSLGYSTSASTVIVVLPQPPLSVTISASSSTAGTTVAYTFTATVTPSTAVVSSYLWNFGDGSSPQLTTGPQTTKTYAAGSGFKTVSVTVTTTTGQTATSSIVINP